jgi:Phosphotransferase enzyme family
MSKLTNNQIIRANLREHPAVSAWSDLLPRRVEPGYIEILHEKEKSAVYRLAGVGIRGTDVIAKRSLATTALIERAIYEEVLPHLTLTALHYYGFIAENDQFSWLFLEDAGKERFSPMIEEHRTLAARWLGGMHTAAVQVAAAALLPDRGSEHYLEHLRSARRTILSNLDNPALTPEDVVLLETIVAQCDLLEAHWSEVEQYCAGMPTTLVHGDFRPKNIHVRTGQAGLDLFALDWETAGWGIPAADLAPSRGLLAAHQVDMTIYWAIVREHWPDVDLQAIERLAHVGRIFRRLAAISWASLSLAYEWVEQPVKSMRVYQAELTEAMRMAAWASRNRLGRI